MKIMPHPGHELGRFPERRREFITLAGRGAVGLATVLACGTAAAATPAAQEVPSGTL